jgi:HSP20 family protein
MKLLLPVLATLPIATLSWNVIPCYDSLFGPSLMDEALMSPSQMLRSMESSFSRTSPHYEITDNEQEMKIVLDVPGVDASNIDVSIDNSHNVLSVSGHRERSENGSSYTYRFSQSFSLDPSVELDKFTANLKNGVLVVTAPKDLKRIEASIRKIPITASNEEPKLLHSAEAEPVVKEELR